MEVKTYQGFFDFWNATEPFYSADPARHTTAITVINRELSSQSNDIGALFLTLHDGSDLVGAALRTPPWFAILSGVAISHIPAAVDAWRTIDPKLPGVFGPKEVAFAFAAEWLKEENSEARVQENLRLYRLAELLTPVVPGSPRPANDNDVSLLVDWNLAFDEEARVYVPETREATEKKVRRFLASDDSLFVWEVNGVPVSYAKASGKQAGMARIGPVYTPPEHRGHGYASAVTAAAAKAAIESGAKDVVLFTDLANPTSNSIYQKIGFRPVSDYVELAFS